MEGACAAVRESPVDQPDRFETRSASWIAAEAAVTETTARGHLKQLVEMAVLQEFNDAGTTTYAPDPLYIRFQVVRELLDEHDVDDLVSLREGLQTQIETWRDEYEVDSPSALRELAAGTDTAEETTGIRRTASNWELATYRLRVVETVIDNYGTYSANQTSV